MKIGRVISELFFPSSIKCVICGTELPRNSVYGVCDKCKLDLNEKFCLRCGRAMKNMADYCDYCQEHKFYFDKARAPLAYENDVRRLIHRLKYGNAKYLAREMAEFMSDTYFDTGMKADIIVPVPMHPRAQRERGYNQAEELAKVLSEITSIPIVNAIKRTKYTKHLAKMSKDERAKAIENMYQITDKSLVKDKRVLLVDNVFTTGATANECSRILVKVGCSGVEVLTFATGKITPELY